MRRYDIVFGILLTVPIIDFKFALAAPVLVQEKLHACVDAVQSPKDVMTVLEKRGNPDDVWKIVEDYFNIKLPDPHGSSSPAPPGPDHGSKVDVPPKPNLASSTANPDPLMGPPSLSPTESSMAGGRGNVWRIVEDYFNIKLPDPHGSSSSASSNSAPLGLDHGSEPKVDVPAPKPNLASSTKSSTANLAPLMGSPSLSPTESSMAGESGVGGDVWRIVEDHFKIKLLDPHASSSSTPLGLDHGSEPKVDVPAPKPSLVSSTKSSTTNPDPLMGPPSLSPTKSSMAGGSDDVRKMVEDYFNIKLPDDGALAHASSTKSPIANPDPLMRPPSPSPKESSMAGGSGDARKTVEEYFNIKLPDPHASSSSEPLWLWPNHVSMTDMHWQVPPNLAASTAKPAPLMESSQRQPSTGTSMRWGNDYSNGLSNPLEFSKTSRKPVKSSSSSPAPLSWPSYLPKLDVPPPTVNPASGIKSSGPHASSSPAPLPWPSYLPKLDMPPPTVNPASGIELGTHFSYKMARPDGLSEPPWKNRKRPRPNSPGPPTVPEQEVGTAPLPNPSSPIEHSD